MAIIKGSDPYEIAEAQLADLFASSAAPQEVYARVTAILHEAIPTYSWVGIALTEGESLVLYASHGAMAMRLLPDQLSRGVSATALAKGELVAVDDVLADPHYRAMFASTRAEIAVPILRHGRVHGVLAVASDHRGAFGLADRTLLTSVAASLGSWAAEKPM